MDANENPYGPSPLARAALPAEWAHIYPTRKARAACRPGAVTGVPAQQLLAGSGADELIDLLIRC